MGVNSDCVSHRRQVPMRSWGAETVAAPVGDEKDPEQPATDKHAAIAVKREFIWFSLLAYPVGR